MKPAVALMSFVMLAGSAHGAPTTNFTRNHEWEAWKEFYKKSYEDEQEESFRQAVWKSNLKKVEENRRSGLTFSLGMNNLADLTQSEYQNLILDRRYQSKETMYAGTTFYLSSNMELPATVNWCAKGCVTPVQNQGRLGRSWAYSATGSLEGQHCIIKGELVSLSSTKLAECCSSCVSVDDAFKYMIAHNDLRLNCNFSKAAYGASMTGYVDIRSGSEDLLQSATAYIGPISVAIDASHSSFQLYQGGIYDEPACSSTMLDHTVLVVGYGTLDDQDYWLVKNSWGTSWGMEGYIMMSRNKENQCGIATMASYPTGICRKTL